MHFWIDKRSQCQYTGRHRVPSSLSSGAGGCSGRACRKAPAPIHRLSAADHCPPSRRPRSRRRHHTSASVSTVQSRRTDDSSLYVEIPVEPPQPTIASLAAARSVTPDTLLRTAALGLNDSSMIAPHLKFGLLVSFVIGTMFLAGAKYYFDKSAAVERHGAGPGSLCAWAGGAAAALCCLAMCRRPSAPPLDPPCRVSSTARRRSPTRSVVVEPPTPASVESVQSVQTVQSVQSAQSAGSVSVEAPPPYHIAVLLPSPGHSPIPPPPAYNALSPSS